MSKLEDQLGYSIDLELFFLQLKLADFILDDDIKQEIRKEWKHAQKIREIIKQNKTENEQALQEQKIVYNNQIVSLKSDYDKKIMELKSRIQSCEKDLQESNSQVESFLEENESKLIEIEALKKDIWDKEEEIKEIKKAGQEYELLAKELQKQLYLDKENCHAKWKIEFDSEEQELLTRKGELEEKNNELVKSNRSLLEQKTALDASLENIQKMIYSNLEVFRNEISESTSKSIKIEQATDGTRLNKSISLYIKQGMKKGNKEECSSIDDYQMIIETNLEQIGCKMTGGELEDYFNAAIYANLIPLLCGFGSRKAAIALTAARYGENPTIISIPYGYSDITALSHAIDTASTVVVVIEDLFGKMNEGIILPILREESNKQLVFCCEDMQSIKYVEQYFFHYVQLIMVRKTNKKPVSSLVYGDATELFKRQDFDYKTEGHKLVRDLFGGNNVSEVFKISRGDMLTYIMEIMEYKREKALRTWFTNEIKWIVTKEQREKIVETIEGNEEGYGNELAESLEI